MTLGRSAGLSDAGRKRRRNEDAFVCEPPLFAVADGMGGAKAGELASNLAAAALREGDSDPLGGEERVVALIQEANRRVYQRSSEDAAASGMGTTMTVALVEDGLVSIGHVGDSRAYLIRDRKLEQLTEDHSLVAELVRSGRLSPEEAEAHPQRSVITRVLGTDPEVDVDTFSIKGKPGDLFLLCSDGLTSMIDDEVILTEVERRRADLQATAKALVNAANRSGGEDNITVVFFEISETGEETATIPAGEAPALDDDVEDDTLSEVDRVPAVDTIVVPPHEIEERARPPRKRRLRRRAALALVTLLALAALCGVALWGLWRSHFVGAERDGHVAVFQGIPWDVAGNVRLYRAVYVSPLLAVQLTPDERRRLFDHDLRSKHSALAAVHKYERTVIP